MMMKAYQALCDHHWHRVVEKYVFSPYVCCKCRLEMEARFVQHRLKMSGEVQKVWEAAV